MYQKLPIGTHQPGLIVVLIDQSESMTNPYGTTSKMDFAALAVNRCIYDILNACKAGERVKDRCHIGVIGYGQDIDILVAGKPSELGNKTLGTQVVKKKMLDGAGGLIEVDQKLPIWVKARAENGTPMHAGFELAAETIQRWIEDNNQDNFPPIVINITDGEPNDPSEAERSALELLKLGTSDGGVLLLNAHIADSTGQEIKLPSDENGLPDEFSRLLFRMSSKLPPPMVAAAQNAGFAPNPGARGFVMNASAETLTKLIVFGSGPMR